jgi:hypothetical protein
MIGLLVRRSMWDARFMFGYGGKLPLELKHTCSVKITEADICFKWHEKCPIAAQNLSE